MTNTQWLSLLTKFYNECREFWTRELGKQGFDAQYITMKAAQNAKQDLANLQHNPYTPQGEAIPGKLHFEFMQTL